jgi:uncharacterized membrane-anchored protein YhcB (DUF1043 family)
LIVFAAILLGVIGLMVGFLLAKIFTRTARGKTKGKAENDQDDKIDCGFFNHKTDQGKYGVSTVKISIFN